MKFMAILESIIPSTNNIDIVTDYFQNAMGISRVTSRILINRGIHDLDAARAFLNPSVDKLFDPYKLLDMDKAVMRIKKAKDLNEPITIYGDYDVDGMTSCAVLYSFFKDTGYNVDVYIPNRHGEGYGINCDAIDIIHGRGTKLLISVDCGITSIHEVEYAKKLGIDVIITDHHQCGSSLPEAVAVINPARDAELHTIHPLAGVGVAGKLVQALGGTASLERYLDLIALGTVADVVPLVGDNRIYVAKGLEKINQNPCPGIEALKEVSGAKDSKVNTGHIAFGLAPRLNAAGRIDDPIKGFELLTSKSLSHARPIAQILEQQNRHRQDMEAQTIREAEELIEKYVDLSTHRIIVLGKEGWNPGVIGIAASKITERYYRPCILMSIEEDLAVGSARSIKGFNIYKALSSCSHLLTKFGGHEQAAGFSLAKDRIEDLSKELIQYCEKTIEDSMLIPRYTYDMDLEPGDITYDLLRELEALEPFGIGNPSPAFLLPDAKLGQNRQVGSQGKHLKVSVELGQRFWDGIAFGMGERAETLSAANRVAIVTALEKNEWRGISKLQFNVKHMDVILEKDEDWEEFLSFFYLKFFDAFFYDFMYNKQYNQEIHPIQSKSMAAVNMGEIIRKLNSTRIGSLVLVNSLHNSHSIAESIMANNLAGRVSFCYGLPNSWDGVGVNTVVFAPVYSKITFTDYRDVYIFEDEVPFCFIDQRMIDSEKIRKVVERTKDHKGLIQLNKEYLVEHSDFASIYRWLRSLSPGRNVWQDWNKLVDDYKKQSRCHINGFKIRLMIKVFEELDFIKVHVNGFVRIQCDTNPIPRKLKESSLFTYYNKWIGNI